MQLAPDSEKKEKLNQWFILLIIFLSRIPFLNYGYGAEEDAWGLAVTAKNIARTGSYEASRFPGHPVQEFIYSLLWNKGAFVFNLLTAIISTAGIGFFISSFRKLNLPHAVTAGVILAFTPVIYLNSTNAMDYMWALSFILISFYFLLPARIPPEKKYPLLSGIFIGLAAGCRITSGAILLPFAFWLFDKKDLKPSLKEISKLTLSALLVSFLVYLPVLKRYGMEFLSYSDPFDATLSKALFKSTIGVWGFIALTDILTVLIIFIRKKRNLVKIILRNEQKKKLAILCFFVLALYTTAYALEPHKAAYLVPVIPFVIILFTIFFGRIYFIAFSFSVILSSFFIGINLNDGLRGSNPSSWSYDFRAAGQNVSFDFLRGPVIADLHKRKNKMEFSENIVENLKTITKKTVIISGFWMNDILAKTDSLPSTVLLVYYRDEKFLKAKQQEGYEIYYLPEQEYYNDLCFKKTFTKNFAKPFNP
jgi:dolichyl-phosphate-mannose-protein mannosyltransferase